MASSEPLVLHLLPSLHVGGVERGVLDLCAARPATSAVASAGGPLEASLGTAAKRWSTLARRDPLSVLLINPLVISAWTRRLSVDVLHAHSRALGVSAAIARGLCRTLGLRRVRYVYTWHGYYDTSSPLKRLWYAALLAADGLIFPSAALRDAVRASFGSAVRADAEAIHRGVRSAREARRDEGAPEPPLALPAPTAGSFRVLLPGRLSPSKGHDLLASAAAHALAEGDGVPALEVALIGARPAQLARGRLSPATAEPPPLGPSASAWRSCYERRLRDAMDAAARAANARRPGRLRFELRPHGALSAAYAAADLVAVPSRRPEAFGRVVVEALAAGRLCATFHHGAASEVGAAVLRAAVEHGLPPTLLPRGVLLVGPLFLVAPCDARGLGAAIREASRMGSAERLARGEVGVRAAAEFGLDAFVRRTLAVYRSCCG